MHGDKAIPHILLVEDDPDHIDLLKAFFSERKTPIHLHVARNGREAWHYLQREAPHADAPRPCLVFLDLKLPDLSGLDLLERMKADVALRGIPVVVLTVSDSNDDAKAAYDLKALAFITKPSTVNEFMELMRRIEAFLNLIELPPMTETRFKAHPSSSLYKQNTENMFAPKRPLPLLVVAVTAPVGSRAGLLPVALHRAEAEHPRCFRSCVQIPGALALVWSVILQL